MLQKIKKTLYEKSSNLEKTLSEYNEDSSIDEDEKNLIGALFEHFFLTQREMED